MYSEGLTQGVGRVGVGRRWSDSKSRRRTDPYCRHGHTTPPQQPHRTTGESVTSDDDDPSRVPPPGVDSGPGDPTTVDGEAKTTGLGRTGPFGEGYDNPW